MTLTTQQRATLAKRGITVLIEYANRTVKCQTAQGVRYYATQDLQEMAKPSFGDRFTAWIGR